ncbi:polysaccharide biosynthesis protein [Polluticoccus soli]|uniref:polysaccharide biosynthesis protein n=1 Tax=Polluticoccus soli TaxID=3034150 RepID=UPI0023E12AF8|nr:nucleoside-diphosphate sugar epimerase/dehydratase [Flavipsychrobacter sp. JY13-12]
MHYKIRILPRWLIFILDLVCVLFSIFFSFVLRFNFNLEDVATYNMSLILSVALLLNASLFYLLKSYAGIIRYTNIEDTFRLLIVNSIAAIFYFSINFIVSYSFSSILLFPISVVVINFFITNFVVITYRLLVRYCFRYYQMHQKGSEGVVAKKAAVYDTSEHGLQTKKVINDFQSGITVVAFLDEALSRTGKLMEGIPIYNTDEQSLKKLKAEGVELLIIANRKIAKDKLNRLVDTCLHVGIKVQQVPPVQEWLNGKLDTQQLKDINIEDLLEREVIRIQNEKIHFELKGKKILVTGAAGSIGSELVRQLCGYRPTLIILCDKAETPMHDLYLEIKDNYPKTNIKAYIGDICDHVRMEHLFEIYNPDVVFHAAAYKHVPLMEDNPSVAVLNNVLGTKILAELSVEYGVEKFVMVSTDKAVNPTNIMGATKRIAEIFTQSFYTNLLKDIEALNKGARPTKFVTTRFGNVLGSNGSVIPRFKQQLSQGGPITVTHPEITRYFMTIPEACQLVIEAGVMGQGNEIFVFDMGEPVKIIDLAKKIIKLAGKEPDVDIKIVYSGLRPGEKLYEELLNLSENVQPTYHDKIMIAKVQEYDFGYVKEKVEKLIASAKQHYTLETVGQMKELVPEFVSANSIYGSIKIDKLSD